MKKRLIIVTGISIVLITSLTAFSSLHDKKAQESTPQVIKVRTATEKISSLPEYIEKKMVHVYVDPTLYDPYVESENDYVSIYQTADNHEKVGELHRGTWVDFLSQTDTMVEIETDEGIKGFIPLENGQITTVEMKEKPTRLQDFKIVLDAGHGGEDSGAVSPDGALEEKELTLETVKIIGQTLADAGVQVTYSREQDEFLSLSEITDRSLAETPDLFISIHYDDYIFANEMSGFTTYYYNTQNKAVAEIINQNLETVLPLSNNGFRFGNYFVLREQYVPSLLLELGYLNSDEDSRQVATKGYQQKVADGILAGIKEIVAQNKKTK